MSSKHFTPKGTKEAKSMPQNNLKMKRIHIITVTNESWGKTRYINPKFALLKKKSGKSK